MGDSKKSSIKRGSSCYLLNLKQPEATAKRLKLSFQRTECTVIVPKSGRTIPAAFGFRDVEEFSIGLFLPELLNKGSEVEVSFHEPITLQLKGMVAWSMPTASGVSSTRFRCRSKILFTLETEQHAAELRKFLELVTMDPIEKLKYAMQAAGTAAQPAAPAGEAGAPPAPGTEGAPAAPPVDAASPPPPAADSPPLAPEGGAAPGAEATAPPIAPAPALAVVPAPEGAPAPTPEPAVAASEPAEPPGDPDSGQSQAA